MKIAILGAGFCGLAVCSHLLKDAQHQISLFDSQGIGGEASGVSAGLLHPFAGLHSKLNWQGREGIAATKELITLAEQTLGQPVADNNGILRPAFTAEQIADFQICASRFEDVEWLTADAAVNKCPGLPFVPALFIRSGITVDSLLYLKGLWKACENGGVQLIIQKIGSLKELEEFDKVVVCLGASSSTFKETKNIPLSLVKGQILELEWPQNLPPIPYSLNSQVYVTLLNGKCMVGSTFERGYESIQPDLTTATNQLIPKLAELYPPLKEAKVIGAKAGIRAVTPNHLPSVIQHNERLYSLTGMGSKGLLYHSLMAKSLVKMLHNPIFL